MAVETAVSRQSRYALMLWATCGAATSVFLSLGTAFSELPQIAETARLELRL